MVRRTPYAFLYLEDDYRFDVESLLRGEAPPPAQEARIVALALLTGERHRLSREELGVLMAVPAERWVSGEELDAEVVRTLVERGLLVSDAEEESPALLRERDEALSANQWNLYAALYHYMTQWSGVELGEGDGDEQLAQSRRLTAAQHVTDHGPPPGPFPDERSKRTIRLPGLERDGALYRTLTKRRTTRAFEAESPMTLEELDAVLRYVFGCHGRADLVPELTRIRRTSPSGGGLHPVEAYPIVTNVAGIEPGIYHYNAREHALGLLTPADPGDLRRTATSFMCGQSYFGSAHVSFVLTARFFRNHWKYRRHHKAYAGILMDAAHLSQTLYLVSGELGLGAYLTIAINARDIEERLGFDGVSEGVIAMAGCGRRAGGVSPLEFDASPEPAAL